MADPAVNPFSDPKFGTEDANPFSDPEFGKPSSIARRAVGDTATSLLVGGEQVGQTAYQLADAATGGKLDRASTGLTGTIADLAARAGDALTGGKVAQVYNAPTTAAMFKDAGTEALPRVGIQGETLGAGLNRTVDAAQSLYSPETTQAMANVNDAKGFLPTLAAAYHNPSAIIQSAVQSLPVSLGMMGGVRMLAERAGVAAATKATEQGLDAAAVSAARNAAIDKFSTGAPGIAAQMGADFATSGAQQSAQAKDAINAMPPEEIAQSPMYQQLIKTMSPEDARAKLADNGQFRAFITAGVLSALTSPISSSLEGKAATTGLRDVAAQKAARDFLGIKGIGKSIATEGTQETLQTAGEQVGTNVGMQAVDPNYDPFKDVPNQAVTGGLTGALMGAAFHGAAHAGEVHGDGMVTTGDGTHIDPNAGMLSAGVAAAVKGGADQTLALPGPDTPYPGGPMITAPDGTTRPATYSDMSATRIAAGRDADTVGNSRSLTEAHVQHLVDLGHVYTLPEAQAIAAIYGARHQTDMSVLPTPDGRFAPIPTKWVAPVVLRENAAIQPSKQLALPAPDNPEGSRLIADPLTGPRPETIRDRQGLRRMQQARAARAQADLESGNTPDVRAATEQRLNPGEGNGRNEEASQVADAGAGVDAATGVQPDGQRGVSDRAGQEAPNDRVAARNDEAGNVEGSAQEEAAGVRVDDSAVGQHERLGRSALDDAAHEAATSPLNDRPLPTPAQIEAGNYAKGHLALHGLDVSIENPVGSTRSGVGRDGREWSSTMQHHYGYIRGTVGRDGEHIDTFIGPNPSSTQAFVVDQKDPTTNRFDEHKVMLGFDSADAARAAYLANHEKGWKGLQAFTSTNVEELKKWLANGATKAPFALQAKKLQGFRQIAAKREAVKPKKGAPNAADQANREEGVRVEHQGRDQGGPTAEAGGGDRIQRGAGSGQEEARQAEVGDHVTVTRPNGKTVAGTVQATGDESYTVKADTGITLKVPKEQVARDTSRAAAAPATAAAPAASAEQGIEDKPAAGNREASQGELAQRLTVTWDGKTYQVASLEDAAGKWNDFRDARMAEGGGGASEIGNGVVVKDADGKTVGRVSYNGRVWNGPDKPAVGDREASRGTTSEPSQERGTPGAPTPAETEATAPEAPRGTKKKLPTHASSLITAIARAGGINLDLRSDILGDKSNRMIRFFGPLFRKAGMQIDELAERMRSDGFMTQQDIDSTKDNGGTNKLMAMIADELRAPNSTTTSETGDATLYARRDASYEDDIVQRAKDAGIQTDGVPTDEIVEALAQQTVQDEFDPTELESSGYDDLSDREAAAVDALVDAAWNREGGSTTWDDDERLQEATQGRGEGEAGGATEGEPREGAGGREDAAFLEGETQAQGEARVAREARAREDAAAARQRANAPDARDFTLTGSDRKTDEVAARGQEDLFGDAETRVTDTPAFKRWFGDSKVVDKDGKPLRVFHGTTANFDTFSRSRASPEADLGAGFYFSNTPTDVAANYAGEGPDLTNKIENLADRIEGEDGFEGTHADAVALARQQFSEHAGATMPVYLKMDNPLTIGGKSETFLDFNDGYDHETEEQGEESGKLVDVLMALQHMESRGDVFDMDYSKLVSDIMDAAMDEDGISASRLFDVAKKSEGLQYATDEEGNLSGNEVLRQAVQDAGFDGVIDRSVNSKFGSELRVGKQMVGMKKGTVHYVVFDPNQIKSATGNSGAFDPSNPSILGDASTPFYSQLERAVADKAPFSKAGDIPSSQLRMWLAARAKDGMVKGDELAATGIDEWLQLQPGRVSKADVQAFLAQNGVKVTETMLGGDAEKLPQGWRVMQSPEGLDSWHLIDDHGEVRGIGDTRAEAIRDAQSDDAEDRAAAGASKFSQYVLPGGANYRELLLTLPPKNDGPAVTMEQIRNGAALPRTVGPDFRSSHFDQPNIVAHVRFNDRTDADGKKVLFLEELQSDWAQQGKRRGFAGPSADKATAKERFDRLSAEARSISEAIHGGDNTAATAQRLDDLIGQREAAQREVMGHGDTVPAGPFVGKTEAWVGLALKRMIRYAAENGYDRVAFTNGEQQAARYDLSKQIDLLSYNDRNNRLIAAKSGERVIDKIVMPERLEDVIGKEIASRVLATKQNENGFRTLRGLDLKVGGEGMKAFYDKIIPNVANDVLKKLGGGRVRDDIEISNDHDEEDPEFTSKQPGFDITPKLRDTVMQGIPLFDRGAPQTSGVVTDADRSVQQAAASGATAQSLLDDLSKNSSTSYNRLLARALAQVGLQTKLAFGTTDGLAMKYADVKFAAAYSPSRDEVRFMGDRNLEKHALHELVHAATVKAIRAGGTASLELNHLYARVKASPAIDQSLYGLRDRFEFVAEAFSNPSFQNALRAVEVPSGKRSLWDSFVNLVRRALGLTDGNALSEALRVGANLMRENEARPVDISDPAHADALGDVVQDIRQRFVDTMQTQKSISWWQRTIGTQYHKAEMHPMFKRVFVAGQQFLQDTSQIAMNAADLAPSLLPKMGTLRDVFRKNLSAADTKAVSDVLFTGTLAKEKYDRAALLAKGLTAHQADAYDEARAAIDRMLDETMASEVARLTQSRLGPGVMTQIKNDPANAATIATRALAGVDPALAESIGEKAKRFQQLKAEGYAPLMRFGQHTVYVVGPDGSQIYFGMEESQAKANALARAMKETHPEATVTQGILSQQAWTMFQGMNPDTIELFAEAMGVDGGEAFQEYLQKAVNNRSALKRLIQRKGVAGFSEDVPRVLASFVTSSARMASKNYNMNEMTKAVEAIPKENGDIKDEAAKLAKYLQNPQDEAPALRGWLFTHFIGGSIASAITNMTQPVLQTLPKLAQYAGAARAASELAKASAMAAVNNRGDAEMQAMLKRAERDGVLAPHELHQLYSESIRGFGSNPYMRRFTKVWGSFFSLAEAFNRTATFIAGYNIGKTMSADQLEAAGAKDAFSFAEKMIYETQGIYNRGNRPNWARGAVGATLFTFKQFTVSYLEFLKRLPPKQQALALAILVMAAGTQGLPFAEDLEDIIDTLGQSLGYDTNSKEKLRQTAVAILGENVGGFVMNGMSSLPGMPIDVQGRLGLSNLIPGTALLKRSDPDKLKEAFEVLGPLGSFVNSLTNAVTLAQQGDWKGIATGALPVAIQNSIKGIDMMQTGTYRNAKGMAVVKTDALDALVKGIGFTPEKAAAAQRVTGDVMQDVQLNTVVHAQIVNRWARGVVEQDPTKIADAVEALRAWNVKNPESPIRVLPGTIQMAVRAMLMTQDARTLKNAPAGMRGAIANSVLQR